MIAAILDITTLAKVIVYSLAAGVGVCVAFALAVASALSLLDALRQRRMAAGVIWGASAAACLLVSLGAVVLSLVVMAAK